MKVDNILQKIENEDLTAQEAFELLYPEPKKATPKGKRAMFIKMKINVPDEGKGVNTLLRVLFAMPIPLIFARLGLRFASRFANVDEADVDFKELSKMLKYSKHTRIQVDSDDAQIDIKFI